MKSLTKFLILFSDGGVDYDDKLLGTNPIALWKENETSGTAIIDFSENVDDGTWTGVTLADTTFLTGEPAPLFDGVNDTGDVSSAGLTSAFDGEEGSLMAWGQVANVGVWTDGTSRFLFQIRVNANNRIRISRSSDNETILWEYRADGTLNSRTKSGLTDTEFMNILLTWSKSEDRVRAYFDGVQEGADLTGLGVFSGASATFHIGSTHIPSGFWSGWSAYAALWDYELTPAQVLSLSAVSSGPVGTPQGGFSLGFSTGFDI